MRFKFLVLALIIAIGTMGIYTSNAGAQEAAAKDAPVKETPAPAKDVITPFAQVFIWAGFTQKAMHYPSQSRSTDLDYNQDFPIGGPSSFLGVKGEKNGLGALVDFGVNPFSYPAQYSGGYVKVRYMVAWYKFTPDIEFRIGNDKSPYFGINPLDVCDGEVFADAGSFDNVQQQIRVTAFGAYIQIMRPWIKNTAVLDYMVAGGAPAITYDSLGNKMIEYTGYRSTDSVIPKLAAGYTFTSEIITANLSGLFQTYKIDQRGNALDKKAVVAYQVSATVKGTFGPASFTIHGFWGQNPGDLGMYTNNYQGTGPFAGGEANHAKLNAAKDKIVNTRALGGNISAGYKLGTLAQINAGFAYDQDRNATFRNSDGSIVTDASMACFANVMFFIQPNFKITPEVKVVDFMKNTSGTREGRTVRFGVAFQASI